MTVPIDWHAPLRCPGCAADAGRPFMVRSKSVDEIAVMLRCANCGREWELARESPTLAPKFDPRPLADDNTPE